MKTLRQYYDSLPADAQIWMRDHCSDWFDADQPDCYKKPNKTGITNALDSFKALLPDNPRYYDSLSRTQMVKCLLDSLVNNPNATQTDIDNIVRKLVRTFKSDCCTDIHMYASEAIRDEIFETRHNERYHDDQERSVDIEHYLYLVKDFDDFQINWDKLYSDHVLNTAIMDKIIGRKNFLHVVKQEDPVGFAEQLSLKERNEIFDELFFCKDGWDTDTKLKILRKRYIHPICKGSNERNLRVFEDFMERIVSVDHSYLRFIKEFVEEVPSIANDIYEQKKPKDELTGNETIPQTYRYSKDIRKLAKIAHACVRKSVSKVNGAFLKEITPLLKLYGYNFQDIYDALYPEDVSIYGQH